MNNIANHKLKWGKYKGTCLKDIPDDYLQMLFNPSYYKDKLKDKYLSEDCYLQPTISDVIMWLYEKHGIWVNIGFSGDESCYLMVTNKIGEIKWNEKGFKSPTEAYEAAIEYTLKNLI